MRVVECLFYVEDSFSVEGANPLIGGEFLGLEEGKAEVGGKVSNLNLEYTTGFRCQV